ncbi:Asp23/Gls24 family envelope stress response protein [Chakrabartyella piscis]|uniref:Asp23/Gls24 family envelope stress response protein n=1 Tax=Chakrabartyella piscis TaxID=2918914 RepID=UPI002958C307|nr:Asp23/Gls24 family envelope stress response protein [Chakrabartyella piscis]
MAARLINEHGTISISQEVVARIAGFAAMECYGIVGMAAKNVKDGLVQLLKIESLTKGIKMRVNENQVSMDLHIIVEYGTNISAIADNIISTVKYSVMEYTGLEVQEVNIFVDGVRVDK